MEWLGGGRGSGNFENGHGWSRGGGPRFFLWSRSVWTVPKLIPTSAFSKLPLLYNVFSKYKLHTLQKESPKNVY